MIDQNHQNITKTCFSEELSSQTTFKTSFTSFITFGDSLADVGNLYITSRSTNPLSPPYADGRFSNGELVPEIIAKELGLSASTPSLAGGDNYAFATAETGSGFSDEGLPNVGEQIEAYLGIDTPAEDDVFFISAGSNNFFPDIDEEITPDNVGTPASVLSGLTQNITTLANAGAENFIIPNIAMLGSLPYAKNGGISDALNTASTEFNILLDTKLDNLEDQLGINIFELDVASEIAQIRANPEAFGLTNVEEPALNEDNEIVVPNPNEYFWWDDFHATTAVSNIVAQAVIDEIPKDTVRTNTNTFSLISYQENSSESVFSFSVANEYLNTIDIDSVNKANANLESEFSQSLLVSKFESLEEVYLSYIIAPTAKNDFYQIEFGDSIFKDG